jgi:hypothetical protein
VLPSKTLAANEAQEIAQRARADARLAIQKHSRHPVAMWHSQLLARGSTLRFAGALLLALSCTSSGNDTFNEEYVFSDEQGRSCRATLKKSSASAPSLSQSVSCEGASKQCSTEAKPCFQLSVDGEAEQVRNCPACCKGTASSFSSSDCSPLVCEADSDCVYVLAKCTGGLCICPNGRCE